MKRICMSMLAIFFPWMVLLIHDNPGGAVVALILQATVIGWIPASIWAWRTKSAPEINDKSSEKNLQS
ncbi:MAG: YqaE/Pmp3 family membrane protein [Chitinophagia bacterium]|nr:YqaE/Pmp3 family membrane protein [Chitinophagia bacterium]